MQKRRGRPPNFLRHQQSEPMAETAPQTEIQDEADTEVAFPDPSAVPMHETLEFKEAVAHAAASAAKVAVAEAMATMVTATAPAASGGDMKAFAEQFAIAMSTMTNQGSGQRAPLAPAEVARRSQATDLMNSLISKAREMAAMGDRAAIPLYELRGKVFFGNFVTPPEWLDASKKLNNTTVHWPHVPNEIMVPMNATARAIHAAFLESVGSAMNVPPEKAGHMSSTGFYVNGQAPQGHAGNIFQTANGASDLGGASSGFEIVRDEARVPGEYRKVNILGTIQAPAVQPV